TRSDRDWSSDVCSSDLATESQIRVLIDAVDRADREGNRREAERALAQARAAAPDDPRVLNVAGMRALLGGDAGAARPLLERAAEIGRASCRERGEVSGG